MITPDIKDLYAKLEANGIIPYIVSASPEDVVEAVVTDGGIGITVPAERVFGMRYEKDSLGRYLKRGCRAIRPLGEKARQRPSSNILLRCMAEKDLFLWRATATEITIC